MPKIQDYAAIGNARSAALISKEGSLDWLCWPRFDSPSLFAHILDDEKGGCWKISPSNPSKIERGYIEATNILVTKFYTANGILSLTDFMTVSSEEKKSYETPEHEILRFVECLDGRVEIDLKFSPRPNYGLEAVRMKERNKYGIFIESNCLFVLQSSLGLQINGTEIHLKHQLSKGESLIFSLTCHSGEPAVLAIPNQSYLLQKLDQTREWWKEWSNQIVCPKIYFSQIVRSALALKLLSFAPSGTYIAAPTTSLPELVGGKLNWDYRYSWLRDASFTSRALYGINLSDEAGTFIRWVLYSTNFTEFISEVFFDVYGRQFNKNKILSHFKGYANSKPIRIGNAARTQFQLDIFGEILDAVGLYIENNGHVDKLLKKMMAKIGHFIVLHWQKPDNGIWESRDERSRHTYSALMCWSALTLLLRYKKVFQLKPECSDLFEKTRQTIRKEIEEKAWNENLKTYTEILNGNEVSISLLTMARIGFEKPDSNRMQLTFKRIKEKLQTGPTLFYRNEDAKKRGEGAFNACNFWVVEFLALGGGSQAEAKKAFEESLDYGNDVGLFSEETDVINHDLLGNFPQAISHSGLINAALSINQRETREMG